MEHSIRRGLSLCLVLTGCSSASSDPSGGGTGGSTQLVPPAQGLQLKTPEFTLQPGQEAFKCYYTSLSNEAEIPVKRFQSWMAPGSHHFILYSMDSSDKPDGTLEDCQKALGSMGAVWIYASQTE